MATVTPVYGTASALTMTLASLASDTNLSAGRSSAAVDQKDTDDAIDILVGGKVTTGATPTASRQIEVWAYGSYDDAEFSGAALGTDANLTPSAKSLMRLLIAIPTDSTANKTYHWGPYSVGQAFGGLIPVQWGIWIVHNTGVALHGTASNHEVVRVAVKYESV